jgi:hypothetical protein
LAAKKPVFINCPFDPDYKALFQAIVFAVLKCGYQPRCALEVVDSGGTRIAKIEAIIEECSLGIHDISRTELDAANKLPRFNMPLELGLFLGAKRFGDASQKRKRCLVLDTERYRYQKFMSDIAGQDIEGHGNDVETLIGRVRSFLNNAKRGAPLLSGAAIFEAYQRFQAELPDICAKLEIEPHGLEFKDLAWVVGEWMKVG